MTILELMRVGRGRDAVAGGQERGFRSHSPSMRNRLGVDYDKESRVKYA